VQVVRYLRTINVAQATLKTWPSVAAFVEQPVVRRLAHSTGYYSL